MCNTKLDHFPLEVGKKVATINDTAPDANGNINVAVMTDKEKEDLAIVLGTVKKGVISQTQTWYNEDGTVCHDTPTDNYHHYVMSNLQRGIIPQANIDLFLSAGAEFNDTDTPITMTAPWGEEVQHLPGYFYLNGLGDISYNEMQDIWNACIDYLGNSDGQNYAMNRVYNYIRTNMPFCNFYYKKRLPNYSGNVEKVLNMSFYNSITKEVFVLPFGTQYSSAIHNINIMNTNSLNYSYGNRILKYIINPIGVGNIKNTPVSMFTNMRSCKRVLLFNIVCSFNLYAMQSLDNYSIKFAIDYSIATTPITITLHADAYARAMADDEILTALENKPLVTLASA